MRVSFVILRYAQDEAQGRMCARLCADIRTLHPDARIYVADNCSPFPPWECEELRAAGVRIINVPGMNSAEAGVWREVARRLRFAGRVVVLQDSCRMLWPLSLFDTNSQASWKPLYTFYRDVKEPGIESVIARLRAPLVEPFLHLYDQRMFTPCFGGMALARQQACQQMYLVGATCVLDVPGALRWERQAVERILGVAARALQLDQHKHGRAVLAGACGDLRKEQSCFGSIHDVPHAFDKSFRVPLTIEDGRLAYRAALARRLAKTRERVADPDASCASSEISSNPPDARWFDAAALQRIIYTCQEAPCVIKQWYGR